MGLFSDFISSLKEDGNDVSSDPKQTAVSVNDEGDVRVHNATVIVNHTEGTHDTVWSNTHYDGQTGNFTHDEGAHGPNYQK